MYRGGSAWTVETESSSANPARRNLALGITAVMLRYVMPR
jgi:hypothetical protein